MYFDASCRCDLTSDVICQIAYKIFTERQGVCILGGEVFQSKLTFHDLT